MYTINKGTMLSCDSDVTGKFHWALSLNHPLGRNICLKVARDIVVDWLVTRRGVAPPEAIRRPRGLLRTCIAGETRAFERQMHMRCFHNGDPWLRGAIDTWLLRLTRSMS